jgi:hypothetical protein
MPVKGYPLPSRRHAVTRWLPITILLTGGTARRHCRFDEFTFRFNRRHSRARGLLPYGSVQQATKIAPVPYCQIVAKETLNVTLRE